METKLLGPVELKLSGDAGAFRARFATFNAVDRDGDVTLPGAFRDGQWVKIAAWGHNWSVLPVGKGVISTDASHARVDGRFFLNTTAGRETYAVVKDLGDLQEWSYGYDVLDAERGRFQGRPVRFLKALNVHEVSPVLVGAGIGTMTEALKGWRGRSEAEVREEMARGLIETELRLIDSRLRHLGVTR
jgi:HK97 family phage prohead protease